MHLAALHIKTKWGQVHRKKVISVYIDLYPIVSEEDFVKLSLKEISKAMAGRQGNIKKIKKK